MSSESSFREAAAERGRGPTVNDWLWLVGIGFAWPAIFQAFTGIVALAIPFTGVVTALVLDAIGLTVVAFFASRWVLSHGAPKQIWIPVAVTSLPVAVALVWLAATWLSEPPITIISGVFIVLGAAGSGMGPAASSYAACRRFWTPMRHGVTGT